MNLQNSRRNSIVGVLKQKMKKESKRLRGGKTTCYFIMAKTGAVYI